MAYTKEQLIAKIEDIVHTYFGYYVPNREGYTYAYQAYHAGARIAPPSAWESFKRSHHLELRWDQMALPDYNLANKTGEAMKLLDQLDEKEGQCRFITDLDADGKIDLKDIYYAVHADEFPDQYRPSPTPPKVPERAPEGGGVIVAVYRGELER